jgi:transposase
MNKKSQKTSYRSLRFLPPDITDHASTTKITRTIKFKPSIELKKYLNKCFGTYRYFYNKGVRYIKDKYERNCEIVKHRIKKNKCCHKHNGKFICHKQLFNSTYCKDHESNKTAYNIRYNIQELRKQLILSPKDLKNNNQLKWQLDIPYDLKQNALRELLSGIKAGIANLKNNNTKYNLKYKAKKALHNTFRIPNRFIKLEKQQMLVGYGKKSKNTFKIDNRTKKWLRKNKYLLNDTITIGRSGRNNYYMYLSYDTPVKKLEKPLNTVAIDPGVRGFCNFYSPDGMEGCLGDKFDSELMKIGKRIDELTSLIYKKKTDNQGNKVYENSYRTRRNMKFRCIKLRDKLRNKVDDLHNKVINFLCINFETIVIPKFNVSNKVKIDNRKINNEVVRRMLSLRHGKFLEKLKTYCDRIKTNLIVVSEEYTSKTCGYCGNIKDNLGNAKVYVCNKCGYKCDRDINASRNILILLLTKLNKMTSQSSDVIPVG